VILIDWLIVASYLLYVVVGGLWHSSRPQKLESFLLAGRSLPWWTVGLSIMATQMSAITLVGTTGQAYSNGLRFIQFYFGLPLAMVLLCLTVVPFFHQARVVTAYEYLERRFDSKTRSLTSFVFLISRGMSCGVIIAAPSVILSIALGWDEHWTVLAMGISTTLYTMFGGTRAVAWADVKQMVVIVSGVLACMFVVVHQLPADVSLLNALHIAAASGKLQAVDTRFDSHETYTLWSGLLGGLFLMLAYFGCDQSQVQRYLSARSVDEARVSLLFNGFAKIPLQLMILFMGILVFTVYQFERPPMIFQSQAATRAIAGPSGKEFLQLNERYEHEFELRKRAAYELIKSDSEPEARAEYVRANSEISSIRDQASRLIEDATQEKKFSDVNYVFPVFITERLPHGLVGLLIAAILSAAMSASAGELNALSTATVVDFYGRFLPQNSDGDGDQKMLLATRLITAFWGCIACVVALNVARLGSLIEVVNKVGSFFYGSLLGVFVLGILIPWSKARGAFYGLMIGIVTVAVVARTTSISFLWYNLVGCMAVVIAGVMISACQSHDISPNPSI